MMHRDKAVEIVAKHAPHEIIVGVYTSGFELMKARPSDLNYFSIGAMGLGSSHALGLAVGLPDRKILVLDGDGSLLMNLGSLVTIGTVAPHNLVHFVVQNDSYEANGGHPIPGKDRVDFAAIAKSAGYAASYCFDDLEKLDAELPTILAEQGPVFVCLQVVPGELPEKQFGYTHLESTRQKFRNALKA